MADKRKPVGNQDDQIVTADELVAAGKEGLKPSDIVEMSADERADLVKRNSPEAASSAGGDTAPAAGVAEPVKAKSPKRPAAKKTAAPAAAGAASVKE